MSATVIERRCSGFDIEGETTQALDIAYEYDYACNWKIAIEGGIEDYHIPFVHPQLGPGGRFLPEFGHGPPPGVTAAGGRPFALPRWHDGIIERMFWSLQGGMAGRMEGLCC